MCNLARKSARRALIFDVSGSTGTEGSTVGSASSRSIPSCGVGVTRAGMTGGDGWMNSRSFPFEVGATKVRDLRAMALGTVVGNASEARPISNEREPG